MIKRPFFILVAFFVYGIFSNFMSWYLLIIISLFLFLIYFLIYNLSKTEYRGLIIKSAYMLFTPLLVIAGAAFGKKAFAKTQLDMELVKKTSAALSGTIEDIRVKDGTLTVTVMDSVITVGDKTYSGIGRTLLYVSTQAKEGDYGTLVATKLYINDIQTDNYMSLMPGMDIYAKGKVYPLTSPTNPGQFDEWMYRRSDGYAVKFSSASLQAYERKNASILGSIRCMAYSVRLKVSEYISDILPQKEAGIAKAMLLAEKGDLDDEIKNLYTDGGITHILAISGLHVSLFAAALIWLLKKLHAGFYPSIIFTTLLLIFYGFVAGFPVSCLRAIIMYLLMLLARLIGKSYDALNALAFAALLILLKSPLMLYNASFLLSFSAVLGILLFYPLFCSIFSLESLNIMAEASDPSQSLRGHGGRSVAGSTNALEGTEELAGTDAVSGVNAVRNTNAAGSANAVRNANAAGSTNTEGSTNTAGSTNAAGSTNTAGGVNAARNVNAAGSTNTAGSANAVRNTNAAGSTNAVRNANTAGSANTEGSTNTAGGGVNIDRNGIVEKGRKTWNRYLCRLIYTIESGLLMSLSVNTFTLPIVLWFYFKQPVYSIFLNLAVIPLMSVLMAGLGIALIACILSAFWGGFLASVPYYILKLYEVLCRINEKMPFNSYLFGRPLKKGLVLYYILLVIIFVIMYYSVNSPKFIMAVFGIHIKDKFKTAENGRMMNSSNGRTIASENGRTITSENGRMITSENGRMMNSASGRTMTPENGRMMNSASGRTIASASEKGKFTCNENIYMELDGKKGKITDGYRRLMVAVSFILLAVIFKFTGSPYSKNFKDAFLDVGQGDGGVIFSNNLTITIDGGSSSVSNVGTYRIKQYLLSQGRNTVNYAFISHSDSDHINGIMELMEDDDVKIVNIVLPDISDDQKDDNYIELVDKADENDINVIYITCGGSLNAGDIEMRCLNPENGKEYENVNDTSEVLFVKAQDISLLYTGDLTSECEEDVIKQMQTIQTLNIDILKVGHHGSKYSSSEEWLAAVHPSLAVISVGVNKYGHPSAETLDRLCNAGIEVLRTDECGAIIISEKRGTAKIIKYQDRP